MPHCPADVDGSRLTSVQRAAVVHAVKSFLAENVQSEKISINLSCSGKTIASLVHDLVEGQPTADIGLEEGQLQRAFQETLYNLSTQDFEPFTSVELESFRSCAGSQEKTPDGQCAHPLGGLQDILRSLTHLTELHLRGIELCSSLKKEGLCLPPEIGRLDQLEILAVEKCSLVELPASVGQMSRLRELRLADNRLKGLPDTCCFCSKLEVIDLTNNKLSALPGFLHKLPNLKKVRRLNNYDLQTTIGTWSENGRSGGLSICPQTEKKPSKTAEQLQVAAALSYLSRGVNYWLDPQVPYRLRWLIQSLHSNMCAICNKPQLPDSRPGDKGYYVYSIQEVFLGNTCVPMRHWACSEDCAKLVHKREQERSRQSGEELRAARQKQLEEAEAEDRREREERRQALLEKKQRRKNRPRRKFFSFVSRHVARRAL